MIPDATMLEARQYQRAVAALLPMVEALKTQVRGLFYLAVLLDHQCPHCAAGLTMLREGKCQCTACARRFDPTTTFQRCPRCQGRLRLRVRRYVCRTCGLDVASRFLFEGLVFDPEYFRQKMAESRDRRRLEQTHWGGLKYHSPELLPEDASLEGQTDLLQALDALVATPVPPGPPVARGSINLRQFQEHLLRHIQAEPQRFEALPPLESDERRNRVGSFIALVFLDHAQQVRLWQQDDMLLVATHEAH